MRTLLLSFALQLLIVTPALGNASLDAIEQAYRQGSITEGQRLYYRVAAVKAPHLLPDRFLGSARAARPRGAPPSRSHFRVMIDAFRGLGRVEPGIRARLRDLLLPPPDLTYTIDSTAVFPVRVSYALPSQEAKAQLVLESAETAYQAEVLDWGFWAPPIEPSAGSFRFYLQDAGGAAGYTSPYLENDLTAHLDAYSYIVIDPSLDDVYLATTVAHELNHACQMAMDFGEQVGFMENTASYVEAVVFPDGWWDTVMTFPYFQAQPWRPLEHKATPSDYYEYGGALWVYFLATQYGDDDPRWIRQIWEGTVQNGPINEPDYFDVLDEMLAAEGGLAGAVQTFSEHRYFLGDDDDGQHLEGAWQWAGSEVWKTAIHSTAGLPVRDLRPSDSSTRPMPNGCNYIELDVGSLPQWPVRFAFAGDPTLLWYVNLLQVADGQATVSSEMTLDASGTGQLSLDVDSLDKAVMVVCQLGGEGYDPDQHMWPPGDYSYSIEYDIPAPTVTSVSPDHVARGSHNVTLQLHGTGFLRHPELAVAISGERVAITIDEYISDQELLVSLTVAPDAELGPRSVTVTNPGGASGEGRDILTIVDPSEIQDAGPDGSVTTADPASGCGCASAAHGPSGWAMLLLWLGLGLWQRRRNGEARKDCTRRTVTVNSQEENQ